MRAVADVERPRRAPARPTHQALPAGPYPVPARLNLIIAALQVTALLTILLASAYVSPWWGVLGLALAYGLAMNSGYAMLHEAEHNVAHPNRRVNTAIGVVLALFFPAPFHLLRQGHLGHHMRNRSDDEAFDLYFAGDNPIWKRLQLFGILTGLYWMVVAFANLPAALWPSFFRPAKAKLSFFDRPTEALWETLNPRYLPWIRLEAIAAIGLHTGIVLGMGIPPLRYLAVLFGFGFLWSALQYAHHYATERDVRSGARNLKSLRWVDLLLLHHNWHLRHHMFPTVPWIHLPHLEQGADEPRSSMVLAYLRMWRGPHFTDERVRNHYAGRIIA